MSSKVFPSTGEKPKFNPNAAYEAVSESPTPKESKPKFNPNKHFEAVSETPSVPQPPAQLAFQINISQPTFKSAPLNTPTREFTDQQPPDELGPAKLQRKAEIAHQALQVELQGNRDVKENMIKQRRMEQAARAIPLPKSDMPKTPAQLTAERIIAPPTKPQDLPVTDEDIANENAAIFQDRGKAVRLMEETMKKYPEKAKEIQKNLYTIDAFNSLQPDQLERVPKIEENAKQVSKGNIVYDARSGRLIQPLGLLGSAIEGWKQDSKLVADYDFLKNAGNNTDILNEYHKRQKELDVDRPIPVPRGRLSEISQMLGAMPLKPLAAGALGNLAGPEAGAAAGAFVGGRETQKREYAGTFWQTLDELIKKGVPENEAVNTARGLAEKAGQAGAFTGAAMGLVGAKASELPLAKPALSSSFKQAAFNVLKQTGSTLGKAGLEGLAVGGLGAAGQYYKNKLAQEAGIYRPLDEGLTEQLESGLLMTVAMAAAIKGGRGISKMNYRNLLHGLSQAPEETLNAAIQQKVDNGEITQKAADETTQRISDYKEKDSQIPSNVTEEARFKIQDNIDKLNELEKQKEATHKSLQGPIQEKIDKLTEDNLTLSKETEKPIKPVSGLSKDQEKEATELAEEWLHEGIIPEAYENAIKKDPIGFWKFLSQQAHNTDENWKPNEGPSPEQGMREDLGDTVVDYAKELFPAPEAKELPKSVSVIQPGEIKRPEAVTIGAGKVPPENIGHVEVTEHGEDTKTEAGQENGIEPSKLSEAGRKEAEELGQHLIDTGKKKVITSEVERAQETAKIAAEKANIPVETNPVLNTWNIGKYDGKPEGSFVEEAWTNKPNEAPEGGESFNDFTKRMEQAYQFVKSLPEDNHVISHSKVMRALEALKKTDGKWTEETTKDFLTNKELPNAIPIRGAKTPNVGQSSHYSPEMGQRIPESGEVTNAQKRLTKEGASAGQKEELKSEANLLKPAPNRIDTTVKLFGNEGSRKSLFEKGFNGLDRKDQLSVMRRMISAFHHDDVIQAIIETVPVDVMNDLIGEKWATETFLGKKNMLLNKFTIDPNKPILPLIGRIINELATFTPRDKMSISAIPGTIERLSGRSPMEGGITTNTNDLHEGKDTESQQYNQQVPTGPPISGETEQQAGTTEDQGKGEEKVAPYPGAMDLPFGEDIGIAHEYRSQRAFNTGEEAPVRGEVMEPEEYIERGKKLIEEGADPQKVADDFKKNGKIGVDDISVVRAEYNRLARETNKAADEHGVNSAEDKAAKAAESKWYNEVVKPMQTAWGAMGREQQGVTDIDTGTFTGLRRYFEQQNEKPMSSEQATKAKELSEKVGSLTKEVDTLKKKLTEAIDKAVPKTEPEKSIKANADKFATLIRKGKTSRPGSFQAATPGSLIWDSALEVMAKTVEAGGSVVQAIANGIAHIKESDWYKSLSEDKQKEAEDSFNSYFHNDNDLFTRFIDKKDSKFTPEDVKDIWDYAKTEYINKGKTFDEMVSGVGKDLGLKPEQVRDAITQQKGTKTITDEMYKKQYLQNQAIQTAKAWAKSANTPRLVKALKFIPHLFFRLKTFGHGTVGGITHAGMNIFRPSDWKSYWPSFFKQFKFAFGKAADYEKAMVDLVNDPEFAKWKRAGLAIDPTEKYDDYQTFDKLLGRLGAAGDRGFNALKVMRLEMAKAEFNRLSNIEKADPEVIKEIAKLVNHATGTAKVKLPEATGTLFFAPRLEASRWAKLIVQPAKAIATVTHWSTASLADKAAARIVAKRSGEVIATYVAALAANQGILSLTGAKQKINFINPTDPDWLKFKMGDKTVDLTGGMVSALGFISHLVNIAIESQSDLKGKKRSDLLYSAVGKYARGKLSPFASTAADFATHHDYGGNTLPFSSDKPGPFGHHLTWKEYILNQQTPIPVAEAIKDVTTQMQERGMDKPTIDMIMEGIIVGVVSGGTGARVGEDFSVSEKAAAHNSPTGRGARPERPTRSERTNPHKR